MQHPLYFSLTYSGFVEADIARHLVVVVKAVGLVEPLRPKLHAYIACTMHDASNEATLVEHWNAHWQGLGERSLEMLAT